MSNWNYKISMPPAINLSEYDEATPIESKWIRRIPNASKPLHDNPETVTTLHPQHHPVKMQLPSILNSIIILATHISANSHETQAHPIMTNIFLGEPPQMPPTLKGISAKPTLDDWS
ncbi:hypothetical protein FKW77_010669 [Venturia effusa]|uniref:Uncharacterized protein n=1 Tax=Venturia effusa TaxID=50376 RepID=A0A517KY46_9PEZI|nr:hypothetical protein FKW77_010669 [Venturia effusa]